jgi:hypothetical protein
MHKLINYKQKLPEIIYNYKIYKTVNKLALYIIIGFLNITE